MTSKKRPTSAQSMKSSTKSNAKNDKVARFVVDMLAVYKSPNSSLISLEDALNLLKQSFAVKQPPKVQKCIMQIWHTDEGSYNIVLRSSEKKKTLETFDIDSVGTPSCSEITIGKYQAQSLVFLPVLNKDNISELFIFHPCSVPAQDIVITLAKILESRHSKRISNGNQSQSSKSEHLMLQGKPDNANQDDVRSLYSISSNFINNWYGKLDALSPLQPNSNSSQASVNEELYLLNQNLKEIRVFMNHVFQVVHNSVHNRRLQKKMNGTITEAIHLPPKLKFIEIVEKIKICLNLAAIHEEIIMNPSSVEIINQLFLFLRIIGDATINHSTGNPDLVSNVINPSINSSTVKFFINHLDNENSKYWAILGSNFGYLQFRGSLPNNLNRDYIDEFQIRKTPQFSDYEDKGYTSVMKKQYHNDNYRYSPPPLVDNDFTYRTFPRIYEQENKPQFGYDTDSLPYQRPASRSVYSNWQNHTHNSTWDDRQCRFIDAVQLRNGRLAKVMCDRSVQNYGELSVSSNEVVEILKDHGDKFSVKNALGEIGDCPKAIIRQIEQSLN